MSNFVLTVFYDSLNVDRMETLTISQVADKIGVTRQTLYTMIRDRRFPVKPIKGTKPKRWSIDAVESWVKGTK